MNCLHLWKPTGLRPRVHQKGTALFAVVPIAILVMSLMVAFVGTSVETSRATVANQASFRARAAAQNASAIAIAALWGDFERATAGTQAQLWNFRTHMDGLGVADQSTASIPHRTAFAAQLGLPSTKNGMHEVDGIEIERLNVYRTDQWDTTEIVIEVDAVARRGVDGSTTERRSSVQEVYTISPPEWEGLDFALLANNVNCLLCHTTIDNAERYYNNSPALAGSYDPVKVGSIDSIHFRSDPDSRIAGLALIGGDAMKGDGTNIADWSKFNLKTAKLNSNMKLWEDGFQNLKFDDLTMFDSAAPSVDATMYLDFFEHQGSTDLTLPGSFPSPYPDNGGYDPVTGGPRLDLAGNRVVDEPEFLASVQGAQGTISGGNISVSALGDKIANSSDRAHLMNGTDLTISGLTDGNVFLHGTKSDPIVLSGDIAINGDVILSGYVIGEGTVRAKGNVYVPGDLLYADSGRKTANRQFGVADDGRTNSLAVAAGGNIVIGDFYRPAWGTGTPANGHASGSFNFTMDELSIFNRQEWMKTQPTLPGKTVKVQNGVNVSFIDEKVQETYMKTVNVFQWVNTGNRIQVQKYKWIWVSNGKSGEYEVKTRTRVTDGFVWKDERERVKTGTKQVQKTRWVKTGNKIRQETPKYEWVTPQVPNPYFVASHMPRYYSFSEGSTVPIFNKDGHFDPVTEHWLSDEHAGEWDSSKLTYADADDPSDPLLYNSDGTPKAVVSTIAPTADWVTADMMQKIVHLTQAKSQSTSKTIEIDATLYSANSILGTVPSSNSPHTDGKLLVNGGIVAADVGILAPNGTQVNYDGRGARALSIRSDTGLVVTRRLSAPLPNM